MPSSSSARIITALASLAVARALPAQSATDSLDLSRALVLARQHAPALRVANARRDIAVGRATEQAQFANPSIEYRRENLGSTLSPDIFTTVYVPFDVTGRRLQLRQARGAATTRATADAAAERRDGEIGIARAWLRAAATQTHADIARRHADALREVAVIDSIRQREGLVSEGVALRTGLEADRALAAWSTAVGDGSRARADLARALGIADREFAAVGTMGAPALPPAPDSAIALQIALASRPEFAAREASLQEARARLGAETRGLLGDWQLQGGSKKTAGVMTGQVGLAVPLPLFNRNDGARRRARGELAEASAWRDDVDIGIRAEVLAAVTAYNAMRAQLAAAATFERRGREVAEIARTSYREGHATLIEWLDAERAASEAMTAHVRWRMDAWLARFELERALGVRLDEHSPLDLPLRRDAASN